jgi:hypothetical protein
MEADDLKGTLGIVWVWYYHLRKARNYSQEVWRSNAQGFASVMQFSGTETVLGKSSPWGNRQVLSERNLMLR